MTTRPTQPLLWPLIVLSLTACPAKPATTGTKPKSPQGAWSALADELAGALDASLAKAYVDADPSAAISAIDELYYGRFEPADRNMEVAIRQNISRRYAAELEDAFAELKRSLREGRSEAITRRRLQSLKAMIRAGGERLDALRVPSKPQPSKRD